MRISDRITDWYSVYKRDLPWRSTTNPYFIWVSEVILQQTRVRQGISYYLKFIDKFQDVHQLAASEPDEVLKVWEGLGYYNRALNMHATAKYIVNDLNGEFPQTSQELVKLKGIGTYTAAAISTFAFGESVPLVDGNVKRVISRLFGIFDPINENKGDVEINKALEQIFPIENAPIFNQAIMEFGALQCIPSPNCEPCPLRFECYAYTNGCTHSLPVRKSAAPVKERYFNYFIIISNKNEVLLQKRPPGDIWSGLYEFPLIESKSLEPDYSKILKRIINDRVTIVKTSLIKGKPQKLTHQKIYPFYHIVAIKSEHFDNAAGLIKVNIKDTDIFPMPVMLRNQMKDDIFKSLFSAELF